MKYLRKAGKRQMPKGGLLNKYYKRKKSDVTVNVPEGIKEIREMANLDSYYKSVFAKNSSKSERERNFFHRMAARGVFSGKPCAGIYRDNRY